MEKTLTNTKLTNIAYTLDALFEEYKQIQPDIKFATYGQAINSKFEDLIVNLKALIKVEMKDEQNETDVTGGFNDIWGYLNTLEEGSEKYQYAFGLAIEMNNKGINPNDHVKEIISDVENFYKK
mgnify:FL=1